MENTDVPLAAKAKISEIFTSLQGEGIYLGERQIFVRFAGCPWRCRYCDTPDSLEAEGHAEQGVDTVLERIQALRDSVAANTVSLTGGEPLAQADFLSALLPGIHAMGMKTYLETSATHPHLFKRVMDHCDVVAADIKLPSAIGRAFWAEHEEFLRLAGNKAFAKVVLTDQTTDEEIDRTVHLLLSLNPVPPLVLQPVTPISDLAFRVADAQSAAPAQILPPPPYRVVTWWDWARQRLPVAKLIPQMHPVWGLP